MAIVSPSMKLVSRNNSASIRFKVKPPTQITKRDGRIVPFDASRIQNALQQCFASIEKTPKQSFDVLTEKIINVIAAQYDLPSVESVQDIVEVVLQSEGEYDAAKHYILYRQEKNKQRSHRPVPTAVAEAFAQDEQYFPTAIQKFQFYDKYSRFNYELGRRETWVETVTRAVNFLKELSDFKLPQSDYERIYKGILHMEVMPSMRLLAMAGPAARRQNLAIYNCSYVAVDSLDAFVEALIISMSGCGVGYSVERQYVEKLPRIKRQYGDDVETIIVPDSAEGWADALRSGLQAWFLGRDVAYDYSQIRPFGAPLRTKGGRASGPEPLRNMLDFIRSRILSRQGSTLRPLDTHDIMCAIGGAAVSGGVRRTAMIALFDYDDQEMRQCKDGDFWRNNSQRWNANNSAVWPERELTQTEIASFMLDMVQSGRGEPGIFNRRAAVENIPSRRQPAEFGTNPCGEIILRSMGLCNLASIVARADDDAASLTEKAELATIIATIQSMATHFPGMRQGWVKNAEEERLLGVDLNGQMDSIAAQNPLIQEKLREHCVATNRRYAQLLGINPAAAITAVKPSGNSSQLLNSSSGLHARWSPYYIRNVRVGTDGPLFHVLKGAGVPMSPENGQNKSNATTWVIHFPVASPPGAITRNQRSALEQCEYWLQNKAHYTEHNPSVTITYKPDEVLDIIRWVWEHQDKIGGMAFLPSFDAQYEQMPYVEITPQEYARLAADFPEIDFAKVYRYEESDLTTAAQELACLAGGCDL